MKRLDADAALNAYFFEARCKLLDVAAILDRIDRGGGSSDARATKLREAIRALLADGAGRAEALQHLFSLAYDETWERPSPRRL
jgi:hypothetical protein